jgi:hypothetical protein
VLTRKKPMVKRNKRFYIGIVVLTLICAALQTAVWAQSQGSTATVCSPYPGDKYVATGSVSEGVLPTTTTHDYIDASQLGASPSNDVCSAISIALANLANANTLSTQCATPAYVVSGVGSGVIDARGIPPNSSGQFQCKTSPFPDSAPATTVNVTILLPAGVIPISAPWYLPSNTRLVGMGSCQSGTSCSPSFTELQASSWTGSTTAMIYMGDSASNSTVLCGSESDCHGISIEHLGLDGGGQNLYGIENTDAQELNSVNDVSLTNIGATSGQSIGQGTGLYITGNSTNGANNSGPYTNIYFYGTGTCLNINGTFNTRGVNGLHCYWTGKSSTKSSTAILLDGANNLIQNVYLTDYNGTDGIAIGSQGPSAQNNVLINITGTTGSTTGATNLIDIYSAGTPYDLTLMGISGGNTYAVYDQVANSNSIPATLLTTGVGLYVLGEPVTNSSGTTIGYSRFTTGGGSNTPAWFQGNYEPTPTDACPPGMANGSLFSNTGTSGTTSLWACINNTTTNTIEWVALK